MASNAANIVPVLSAAAAAAATATTTTATMASEGSGGRGGAASVMPPRPEETTTSRHASSLWQDAEHFEDEETKDSAAIAGAITADDAAAIEEFRQIIEDDRLKMTKVFKAFDATGDKTIGMGELRDGLRSLGVEISDAETARILQRFDITGDGKIKYFEFVRMCHDAIEIA